MGHRYNVVKLTGKDLHNTIGSQFHKEWQDEKESFIRILNLKEKVEILNGKLKVFNLKNNIWNSLRNVNILIKHFLTVKDVVNYKNKFFFHIGVKK